MAKKGELTSKLEHPTSLLLDEDTRTKLDEMATSSGQSRSQIMRGLIQGADGELNRRLAAIAGELNDLLGEAA